MLLLHVSVCVYGYVNVRNGNKLIAHTNIELGHRHYILARLDRRQHICDECENKQVLPKFVKVVEIELGKV